MSEVALFNIGYLAEKLNQQNYLGNFEITIVRDGETIRKPVLDITVERNENIDCINLENVVFIEVVRNDNYNVAISIVLKEDVNEEATFDFHGFI